MNYSDDPELLKLIENEIDLGFTFFQTATIASGRPHTEQALAGARKAHDTAAAFLLRVAPRSASDLRMRLQDLGNCLHNPESLLTPLPRRS